ncbi:MAG: carbon monoxide dehydrogenase subunit G [Burkholderiaceae bacterium]|nr:carbon monoxide dehydrogenase subunit G [Burkholderiaceae bacterium]
MNLQGERLIPATPEATWAALNDPETLAACIAGCESLERVADDEYLATIAMRIGPVNARFKGRLKLQNVVAPSSYTLAFDGQGGAAGFGKGSANVRLSPDPEGTRLGYDAKAQIGGKLAQVGSRLIDGAAAKIADDFFTAFAARLSATTRAVDETIVGEPGAPVSVGREEAGIGGAPAGDARRSTPPAGAAPTGSSLRWLAWIVAIAVVAALIAYWRR